MLVFMREHWFVLLYNLGGWFQISKQFCRSLGVFCLGDCRLLSISQQSRTCLLLKSMPQPNQKKSSRSRLTSESRGLLLSSVKVFHNCFYTYCCKAHKVSDLLLSVVVAFVCFYFYFLLFFKNSYLTFSFSGESLFCRFDPEYKHLFVSIHGHAMDWWTVQGLDYK